MPTNGNPRGPDASSIIEGIPIATLVIDAGHRITHWNRACEQLTGIPAAEIVGTTDAWRAFYAQPRPILANLVADGADENQIDRNYHGRFHPSRLVAGAYEAEDFFPHLGEHGRWLFFTAAPLHNAAGEIAGALETLQDVTERRNAEQALRDSEARFRRLSLTDALTGLYNARHLHEQLPIEINRTRRYGHPLSILLLDADHFKRINDTQGHLAGDEVLQQLSTVMAHCLRRSDSAYRYGGEEFLAIMPETDEVTALTVAERLRRQIADHPMKLADGTTLTCTVSIGIATYRPDENAIQFMQRADAAVYAAKHAGRNRVVAAPPV